MEAGDSTGLPVDIGGEKKGKRGRRGRRRRRRRRKRDKWTATKSDSFDG